MYSISSRGQPTIGNPPGWGLGEGLTTPHHKKKPSCYETQRVWMAVLTATPVLSIIMYTGFWFESLSEDRLF